MKAFILSILFLVPMTCCAQVKNAVQDNQLKDYIEITNPDISGAWIRIDQGGKIERFLTLDGKKYYFESCISAVKFLESKGWKLEVAQVSGNDKGFVRYYLMSKVVTKEELEKEIRGVTEK